MTFTTSSKIIQVTVIRFGFTKNEKSDKAFRIKLSYNHKDVETEFKHHDDICWNQEYMFEVISSVPQITFKLEDSSFFHRTLGQVSVSIVDWENEHHSNVVEVQLPVFHEKLVIGQLLLKIVVRQYDPLIHQNFINGQIDDVEALGSSSSAMNEIQETKQTIDQNEKQLEKMEKPIIPDIIVTDQQEVKSMEQKEIEETIESKLDEAINEENENEQRKQQVEKISELEAKMESIEVLEGDYRVYVHIIQVKNLIPSDINGEADPVVYVDVWGHKAHTRMKTKRLHAFFDETFTFELTNMKLEQLEGGEIKFTVYDADGVLNRDDVIGSVTIDFDAVYYADDHELYRQWAVLTKFATKDQSGVCGYIQFSLAVLGPRDRRKVRKQDTDKTLAALQNHGDDPNEELDVSKVSVFMPEIKQQLHYLVVKIFDVKDLPPMDTVFVSGGIDFYLEVNFNGEKFRSNVKNANILKSSKQKRIDIDVNEQIWIPILIPSIGNLIKVSVWDEDRTSSNELVGYLPDFNLSKLPMFPNTFTRWFSLYGAPLKPTIGGLQEKINQRPSLGSFYRGKVLLSISHSENPPIIDGKKKRAFTFMKIYPTPSCELPILRNQEYIFRARIFAAVDVKVFDLSRNKIYFEVSIGMHVLTTSTELNKGSVVTFSCNIMEKIFTDIADITQLPDVFVYLCYGDERIAYARLNAQEVNKMGANPNPIWLQLTRDEVIGKIKEREFPGSVLLQMGIGPKEYFADINWIKWNEQDLRQEKIYQLRCFVYAARSVPASDDDGLVDPYLIVCCCGKKAPTSVAYDSTDPDFYEMVEFDISIPSLPVLPELFIQLWDKDIWTADDYVGSSRIQLWGDWVISPAKLSRIPEPNWYKFCDKKPGDLGEARLLTTIQLIEKTANGQMIANVPFSSATTKTHYLDITIVGCRDLRPRGVFGIHKPYLELQIGKSVETIRPSRKPSPSNPNFLERIVIPVEIPFDLRLAPPLSVMVFDKTLGGLSKTLLGSTRISLLPYLPGRAPMNLKYRTKTNPFRDNSELEDLFSQEINNNQNEPNHSTSITNDHVDDEEKIELDQHRDHKASDNEDDDSFFDCDDGEGLQPYLNDRKLSKNELERHLNDISFEKFPILCGKYQERMLIGFLKAKIELSTSRPTINNFVIPSENLFVRVYVLQGSSLASRDLNMKSDPFLKVKLGKKSFDTSKNYIKADVNPNFFESFEFKTTLPGTSELTVEIWDHDDFNSNDLIGSTIIDLEDRWFSARWKSFEKKPLESRSLWIPTSQQPQGNIALWVDILSPEEAESCTLQKIGLPPEEEFEVRIILWKTRNIRPGDEITGMSDLYITVRLGDSITQSTDTHLRSNNGFGSFNWRMKFRVKMPLADEGASIFLIEVWDCDVLYNDLLGDVQINIAYDLIKAWKTKQVTSVFRPQENFIQKRLKTISRFESDEFKEEEQVKKSRNRSVSSKNETEPLLETKPPGFGYKSLDDSSKEQPELPPKQKTPISIIDMLKEAVGVGPEPLDARWLPLTFRELESGRLEQRGEVLITIDIIPKLLIESIPAGFGRSEPNQNPTLPNPVGRPDLSKMWNPLYMLQTCLGDQLVREFYCCCCCLVFVALMIAVGPFFMNLMPFLAIFPFNLGYYFLFAMILSFFIFMCITYRKCVRVWADTKQSDDN